jgi:hypothetical protein
VQVQVLAKVQVPAQDRARALEQDRVQVRGQIRQNWL